MTIIHNLNLLWGSLFRRSRTNPFDSSTHTLKLQKFSYKELKSATNQFNQDNFIGKGGSGTVFRGILRDGKSVAIKKLDVASSLQAEKEFQSELTILGSVKSPHIVSLIGYCVEKNKRLLVYEYMSNRSLQEFLFRDVDCNGLCCMNWEKRFQVIEDVCRAVEFLHNECDPPVIHGDIKPSNVLLDWGFKAKLSDFGLSRVKVEDDVDVDVDAGVDMFSQDLGVSQELSRNLDDDIEGRVGGGEDVDFALALQPSSSSKKGRGLHCLSSFSRVSFSNNSSTKTSPKGKVVVEDRAVGLFDHQELFSSIEQSKEPECLEEYGKDGWLKHENNVGLCSKEYVDEWIGVQINEKRFDKKGSSEKTIHKSKPRKMQEWWEEEQLEEMSKKNGSRKTLKSKIKRAMKMPSFVLDKRFYFPRQRCRETDHYEDEPNDLELSVKRDRRRKNSRSMGSDMSGELSTSTRGTLCYIAPEYGGCGYLMEKGDIYSLGVLMLVIISGRRPLHVLNSPMKLEKANLVSWCRHLAHTGNVLELVDQRLKDAYDKDQVILCIHLALACLQRVPDLRPDMGDILRALTGEMDLPPLPFDFSPSPSYMLYSKSRRKSSE